MSIADWTKCINRWQSQAKAPLSIHAQSPRTVAHIEKSKGYKRYYFNISTEKKYLTQREMEICLLLLNSLTYNEIGEELGITGRTVEFYTDHLKAKLNTKNKKGLVSKIKELNLDAIKHYLQMEWE